MWKYFIIPLYLWLPSGNNYLSLTLNEAEDCFNGIDDDGDGLIDAFDLQCRCVQFPPVSYTHLTLPTSDLV